jgi:hypothetical protein
MSWQLARQRTLADGTIRLRPSWSTVLWSLFPLAALAFPFVSSLGQHGSGFADSDFRWFCSGLLAVEAVLMTAVLSRRVVLLRPDRLSCRNIGRWQDLQARDIQAVTLSGDGLTQTIQVWTQDRRVHRIAGITPADITVLGDWWLSHRGSEWQPAWTPYPPAPSAANWWT